MRYASLNKGKTIGVITPFVNQKNLIEQALKQNQLNNVTCGTVHAFQGDEKDVILFSTAITDKTQAKTILPKTGTSATIIIALIILVLAVVIFGIKNRTMKDIK